MFSKASASDLLFVKKGKNMTTKEEIAQNKQFLLLSSCLYSIIVLSIKGSFQICSGIFSKSSAANMLYVGKC